MIQNFLSHIGLEVHATAVMLFFLFVFVGAIAAAVSRRSKQHYHAMAQLALEDDHYGKR